MLIKNYSYVISLVTHVTLLQFHSFLLPNELIEIKKEI